MKDSLPESGRGSSQVSHLGKSIDEMIHEVMVQENIPGLALAIVQAPYIPRIIGYGLADLQTKCLASNNTIWAIGPISQIYAAVATMQLVEKGKLNLKDKVANYLKSLPEKWNGITVLQLLQHATGIADYRQQEGYDPSKSYTSEELIALVKNIPLAFNPGTQVAQSATNYLLLADVIEVASGMSYRDFVTKNQIELLGLKQTCFAEDFPKIKQEKLTASQTKHHEFLKSKDYIDPTEKAAGYNQELEPIPTAVLKGFGDIWASAENVSFWDIALAGSVLIAKPENREVIYAPTTLDNGKVVPAVAGWEFPHHKGLMESKGTITGFSSFLSRFTDQTELVCVTILANKEGLDFTNLARRIASVYGQAMSSGINDNELYAYESIFSAKETMQRIEEELKALKIPIFAKFDHGKNADEVHLDLRPTEVIVFGSPSVGTKLMQANQSISIDLPLKIAVWEDERGRVWAAFPQMDKLTAKYSGLDKGIAGNMQKLLEKIVRKAAKIY